jgi:hypothetical protein
MIPLTRIGKIPLADTIGLDRGGSANSVESPAKEVDCPNASEDGLAKSRKKQNVAKNLTKAELKLSELEKGRKRLYASREDEKKDMQTGRRIAAKRWR